MAIEVTNDNYPESGKDWNSIFDELRQTEGLVSDAGLARSLGVTPAYICSIRKGRKTLSLHLAQQIFERLDRTISFADLAMFAPARIQKVAKENAASIQTRNRRLAIVRAAGHCQLCGAAAPFTDREGRPYLETHLVVPLADGGSPTTENMVALCPNCHRKIQVFPSKADQAKLSKICAGYVKKSEKQSERSLGGLGV